MLAFGGLYQFGRWKTVCLHACRSPLGFVLSHDFGGGATSAFRAGVSHGAYCLGCCWALMTLLVVVGLMNLVWMAVLTLLFFAEKNWRHGIRLGRLAGTALLALGRRPRRPVYAHAAGYSDVEVFPIENDFWRFYRLHP